VRSTRTTPTLSRFSLRAEQLRFVLQKGESDDENA
jgi:hypothetical protein